MLPEMIRKGTSVEGACQEEQGPFGIATFGSLLLIKPRTQIIHQQPYLVLGAERSGDSPECGAP